jgi:membrane protease YdiL (CAAX protease family)
VLRLRGRSIWPLVALHAVNNFAGYLTTGHWEAVESDTTRFAVAASIQLAFLVVLVAYGAAFLWNERRRAATGETAQG